MRASPLFVGMKKTLLQEGVCLRGKTLVVGLSGGPDSVALLDALSILSHEEGFTLFAAHLNHNLRQGSASDARFCGELCARLGVPFRVGSAQVRERALRDGGGLEEAARRERYEFLRGTKDEVGASAIAVAHTRDDQAETFLMRLLRGSGGSGLASMRVVAGDIIRPLLGVSRAEVVDHLRSQKLSFCEDPTNADTHWMRNRVRHELLPYLESRFHPRIKEALSRTAGVLADEDEWLSGEARKAFSTCALREGNVLVLPRSALAGNPALARRILRAALAEAGGLRGVGASHVEGILALAASASPSGRRLPLPGRREVVFHFDTLRIGPTVEASVFALPLPIPGKVLVGGLAITARSEDDPEVSKGWEAIVAMPWDASLIVRSPRAGDRVRLGGRSRSLNRLLMERRVPRDARRMLPVVESGERVVFVPGETLDLEQGGRRVRIAAATA